MPQITVSEGDFEAVAHAAVDAQDEGRHDDAEKLDKLARKINAALSHAAVSRYPDSHTLRPSWQEMPSTLTALDDLKTR